MRNRVTWLPSVAVALALCISSPAQGDTPLCRTSHGTDKCTGTNGNVAKVVAGVLTIAAIAGGDLPTGIDVAKLAAGTVSNTVFGYLANVSSDIQAQLNGKQATLTLPLLVANGGTNSSTALVNNRPVISSGGKLVETASACSAGYILGGGSPPDCTQSPTVGTKITVPRIDSPDSLILNGTTANNVQLSVNSVTVFTAAAGGLTAAQPLAMSSQKITGLASATASGDALSYPWVTSNIVTAVATTTALADSSGTYTDVTGATLSLTAGTHIVATTLRAEIGATTGAGAFITCRLHDGTNPITSTETLITQDNQPLVLAQNTTTLIWPVTVGSTTSVKAQCTRVFSGVLFTSDIPSDSNGRSRMFSVQTAP